MRGSRRCLLSVFVCLVLVVAGTSWAVPAPPVRARVVKTPATMRALEKAGGRVVEDYGTFLLVELPDGRGNPAARALGSALSWLPDDRWVGLRDYPFETKGQKLFAERAPARLLRDQYPDDRPELFIVQFAGPVRDSWLEGIRRHGGKIIDYVPDYAYVVLMRPSQLESLKSAPGMRTTAGESPVAWTGIHQPAYRISRQLLDRSGKVKVDLLLLDNEAGRALAERLAGEAEVLLPLREAAPYLRLRLLLDAARLEKLAYEPGLYWMEEWVEPRPCGEVGALNMAGQAVNGEAGGFGDAGMGWLAWLQAKGFDTSTPSSFVVNVTDTGLDKGNRAGNWHQDLYDAAGSTSRVVYVKDWTGDAGGANDGTDGDGHGTNCAGVVGGYNNAAGSGNGEVSGNGYHFGLGVAPFVKLGGSKVFNYAGSWNMTGTYAQLEGFAWSQGARISSNSWGAANNSYTTDARTFDTLVRDASGDPGNQEMIILFAAGNDGPAANTVGSPGTAKNVITLGAAENWWPSYNSCGWPSAMQDSPGDDIVYYSSRGPTADGRRKPDLVAIANGWNTIRGQFAGTGCGAPFDTGDGTLYRNFNGTSAATPAAAGAAALIYQWALDHGSAPPSPAMMKAILVATARDLAGGVDCTASDGTGPTLQPVPNDSQGWGLVDLGRALDGTATVSNDQQHTFAATGEEYRQSVVIDDPTKPVRVVLAWTDAPGNPGADPWMNDLDLQVTHGGSTYLGNVFSGGLSVTGGTADFRNNLESVFLPAGTTGSLEIVVRAANIAADGVPGNSDATDQDFALYVYNGTECTAPAAPASLSATAPSDNRIDLQWSAVGGGITGYAIYRSKTSGGPYSQVDTVGAAVTSYSDTTVSGGTTYYYVVRSILNCESPDSVEASAAATGVCTAPPEFSGLSGATSAGQSTCGVSLNWNAAVSQCGGQVTYRIYRSTTSGFTPGSSNIIAAGLSGTSHTDTSGVQAGTTYYYVVRAVDSVGGLVDTNVVERSASPAGPASGPVTYNSTDTPRAIPDNFPLGITSTLTATGSGTLADVQLDVNITHTYRGDLVVKLTSPQGTSVTVHNGSGGAANDINTTYDLLTSPDGPGSMNDFDGEELFGDWKLQVSDNASFDTGTLQSWSLQVETLGSCTVGASGRPGEVSPAGDAGFTRGSGSVVNLGFTAGVGSTDTTVYRGSASAGLTGLEWVAAHCSLGTSGTASFDPGTPAAGSMFYFVAVANDGQQEGSYGHDSSGGERVDANGLGCDYPQILVAPGPVAPGKSLAPRPGAPAGPRFRKPLTIPPRLRAEPRESGYRRGEGRPAPAPASWKGAVARTVASFPVEPPCP
ncbi:MAG: S8 family serine peptidase [Acidobacteriota bacterium]|nr:S8 family serine peptidase [Acidobacteriota bacterium]MDQ7087275.1 S8 family serine peptidase [Acidobacteriota bacterium]